MKIYLAGPLFSAAERDFNATLAKLLRGKGHDVYLPQEAEQETMSPQEIFLEDVRGIDGADAVVANMDGADPDSGTCWECGYAYRKKRIVVFRTDFRIGYELRSDEAAVKGSAERAPYNLMLTASADVRLDLFRQGVGEVAARVHEALRKLSATAPPPAPGAL
jgi:nucleoside 2-deoxyribosyltransferase